MAKKVLSIEIGLRITKVCEVSRGLKSPKVYKAISFDTPMNTIEDGYIRDKKTFSSVLKTELKRAKMKTKDVMYTIASTKIANREVMIPLVKEKRIQAVVDAQAQEYFPVDITEYTVFYNVIERIEKETERGLKLFLIAAPDNLIKNYYSFSEDMGFHLVGLDYIGNSALQLLKQQVSDHANIIVQINEQTTLISILDNKKLALQRTVPYGSNTIIDAVLENPVFEKQDEKAALELLVREKILYSSMDYNQSHDEEADSETKERERARGEVTEALNYHIRLVATAMDYFHTKNPDKEISRIYITGYGSKIQGIEELITNELRIKTQRITSLGSTVVWKVKDNQDQTEYISVIGATIKPIEIRLKEAQEKENRKSNLLGTKIIFGLSVLLALTLVGVPAFNKYQVKKESKELDAEIESLSYIRSVYDEENLAKSEYQLLSGFYGQTIHANEKMGTMIQELEENLPSSMIVESLSISETTVVINIQSPKKITVAEMLVNFKNMTTICNPQIPSVKSEEMDGSKDIWRFTVTCDFTIQENPYGDIGVVTTETVE